MKFDILLANVTYGGSPTGLPQFKAIHENVSADFVRGFFSNKTLDKTHEGFSTKPDEMGCYDVYRIDVSRLD